MAEYRAYVGLDIHKVVASVRRAHRTTRVLGQRMVSDLANGRGFKGYRRHHGFWLLDPALRSSAPSATMRQVLPLSIHLVAAWAGLLMGSTRKVFSGVFSTTYKYQDAAVLSVCRFERLAYLGTAQLNDLVSVPQTSLSLHLDEANLVVLRIDAADVPADLIRIAKLRFTVGFPFVSGCSLSILFVTKGSAGVPPGSRRLNRVVVLIRWFELSFQ